MDNSIELNKISKAFGSTDAVRDLDLAVKKGEIFGFLGPNGAGKSTTIRMITGILQPDQGDVTIEGVRLDEHPVEAKKHIGYIPDDPFVYRYLSGNEFLNFVSSVYGVSHSLREKRKTMYLKQFSAIESLDAPFYTYSRGTRQKLVFIAALLHEPAIFVIDEPMVGLDPQSARAVKDILRHEVSERGATVFLSTHTLSVAEELCDRVAIIDHGKMIACGAIDELKTKTHHKSADLEDVFLSLV